MLQGAFALSSTLNARANLTAIQASLSELTDSNQKGRERMRKRYVQHDLPSFADVALACSHTIADSLFDNDGGATYLFVKQPVSDPG